MALRKLSQTLRICLALMVAVFSTGILPASVAYATPGQNNGVGGGQEVCPDTTFTEENGGWVKTEDLTSTTFPVPPKTGFTVTDICYKASNDAVYPEVSTTVTSTVTNQNGEVQNLSHVSVYYTKDQVVPTGSLSVSTDCEEITFDENGFTPEDATVTFTLDGVAATAGAHAVAAGSHTVVMFVNGTQVDSKTVTVSACEEERTVITTPNVNVEVSCGPNNDIYSVAASDEYDVTNNGNGTFTLTAAAGFEFENGETTLTLTAPADENTQCEEPRKVFVCKYVGTPGIDERLQTGQNPISVSVNAIPNFQGVGSFFADAQGRSFVLAFDEGQEEPDASECPTGSARDLDFNFDDICTEDTDGEVSVEIDNDGNAAANNLTVNLYDDNGTLLDTQTVDVAAGDDVEVEFGGLAEGTYTIRVFDGNTELSSEVLEVDECGGGIIDVCPNVNGIQLVVPNGLVKDDNGDCVTDQCPLVPGVQTDTTLCPPGQGGGQTLGTSTTTTPQVLSTSTELPATIPATGGSSNPLMIVLAGVIAYGAAYFLQGRRQLTREQA